VAVENVQVERYVGVDDFIDCMTKRRPVASPILPRNCVLYANNTADTFRQLFVIQEPAGIRRIRYKHDRASGPGEGINIEVSMPMLLWFFTCTDMSLASLRCAAVRRDLSAVADPMATPLLNPLLPNFRDNGTGVMCTGRMTVGQQPTLAKTVDALMRAIWDSEWNLDLGIDYANTGLGDMRDWAHKSTGQPGFHERIAFPPYEPNQLGGMVRRALAQRDGD